ncbi:uncharacterized protein LOC112683480, partial [Sipha flava]
MEDLSDELVKWLLPHEGYLYKYKCTEEAQPLRTLWHCTESGCKGQVVAVSVRSKRWSRHRKLIFVPGDPNCLSMTVIKWHRHNHKANVSAVHAKRRPRTAGISNTVEETGLKPIDPNYSNFEKRDLEMKTISDANNSNDVNEHIQKTWNTENCEEEIPHVFKKIKLKPTDPNISNSEKRDLEMKTISVAKNSSDINEHIQRVLNTENNNQQKTEPVKLIRCSKCHEFIVKNNDRQHMETIAHKISMRYFKQKNIQINRKKKIDCIISCRILSPRHDLIDDFFSSIESNILDLVDSVIKLGTYKFINVDIFMYVIYDDIYAETKLHSLGNVKKYMVKDENLSSNTILLNWFQIICNKFKTQNKNYLKQQKSKYLSQVLFLDINFNEVI